MTVDPFIDEVTCFHRGTVPGLLRLQTGNAHVPHLRPPVHACRQVCTHASWTLHFPFCTLCCRALYSWRWACRERAPCEGLRPSLAPSGSRGGLLGRSGTLDAPRPACSPQERPQSRRRVPAWDHRGREE